MEIFSDKLGKLISIIAEDTAEDEQVMMEDSNDSLVGWTHGGWNNDSGGAGW